MLSSLPPELIVAMHARRADINKALIAAHGRSVMSGPFAGMALPADACWGDGDMAPKLLGIYEAELHAAIAKAVARDPKTVVNIGSAEGYYAVGMARLLPQARVLAFETDERGRDICRRAAAANQVDDRVAVAGTCDTELLSRVMSHDERPLLIVDGEGAELALLDPAQVPGLSRCDMIVECHDFIDPRITPALRQRFEPSHEIENVLEGARDPNMFARLRSWASIDRWLAVNENRPVTMNWLVCWSRQRNGAHQTPSLPRAARHHAVASRAGDCSSASRSLKACSARLRAIVAWRSASSARS
jgi:hypothetical protein